MTASQRRSTWPATTVVAHVVLALLTVLILAGVWHLGADPWQIFAAAGAVVAIVVAIIAIGIAITR